MKLKINQKQHENKIKDLNTNLEIRNLPQNRRTCIESLSRNHRIASSFLHITH